VVVVPDGIVAVVPAGLVVAVDPGFVVAVDPGFVVAVDPVETHPLAAMEHSFPVPHVSLHTSAVLLYK